MFRQFAQTAAPLTWAFQSLARHYTAVPKHFTTFRQHLLPFPGSLEDGMTWAEAALLPLKGMATVAPGAFVLPQTMAGPPLCLVMAELEML